MKRILRLFIIAAGIAGLTQLNAADMKSDMGGDIVSAYVKVTSALAADNLADAKAAAKEVAGHADMAKNTGITEKANALAKAGTIEDARKELIALTAAVEPLAKGNKSVVVMHCPMVGADWIQTKGGTKNPYYGKSMLTCGAPKEVK